MAAEAIGVANCGLSILEKIWKIIKGTRKIKAPEDKQFLENSELRKNFLNNNPGAVIIQVQGDMYIGDSALLNQKEKEMINNAFSEKNEKKEAAKQIEVIESDFYERIKKMKMKFPRDNKINPFMQFLESDIRNILSLSIYAKRLFDEGDSKEARKIREDIGSQYGKEGRKLCNLYLSGYIDGMTEYLKVYYDEDIDKIQAEINKKIKTFVLNSDYILFIHSESIESEVMEEVKALINKNKEYIALHGAGNNIYKVRKILDALKDTLTKEKYDINEEKLKTLSLCPLINASLTKKKRDN
jgi:hypothetical protein